MKVNLEFNLPEDREEYDTIMKADDMESALAEIRFLFRECAKYRTEDKEGHCEVYERICNILEVYECTCNILEVYERTCNILTDYGIK